VKLRRTTMALAKVVRPGSSDLATAAGTSVQQAAAGKRLSRVLVDVTSIALPAVAAARTKRSRRKDVRYESEPVEVVEDARFVLGLAALAVVVFDAKKNAGAGLTSEIPHVVGVQHMAEVQVSRRGGRETRESR
jgi:hypothetical protein